MPSSDPSRSDRELVDLVHEEVGQAKTAAVAALKADTWTCSDGHQHPRPATFTHNRLAEEVNRRAPGNLWSGSVISLAIWALKDDGWLDQDTRWRLSIRV